MQPSIFKTELKMPEIWQQRVLHWVDEHSNNPYLVYEWHPFRLVSDLHNISLASRELIPRKDRLDFSQNIEWQWLNEHHKIDWMAEVIAWIQSEAKAYFSRIGTVSLQIWQPGNQGLAPHFDFRMHKKSNHPRGGYADSQYWRLFFPVSAQPDLEIEKPPFFLIDDESEVFATSHGHAYFMHDPTTLHGVKPRPYQRGFIFVDGILDPLAFSKIAREPLQITSKVPLDPVRWPRYFHDNDLAEGDEDTLVSVRIRNNSVLEKARQVTLKGRSEWDKQNSI